LHIKRDLYHLIEDDNGENNYYYLDKVEDYLKENNIEYWINEKEIKYELKYK